MNTQHTPGPWMICENHVKGNDFQYSIVGAHGSKLVAEIIRHNSPKVGKSKFTPTRELHPCAASKANAHLIEAAPDLLIAAKQMFNRLSEIGYLDPNDDTVRKWKSAINKALGSQ